MSFQGTSFFVGPRVVLDGLILQLDPANIKSYPGSGTTIFDTSIEGAVTNATTVNSPTFNPDSIQLDENLDQRFITNQPSVTFNPNQWTIELVLKPLGVSGYLVSPASSGFDHFLIYSGGSQNINFQTTQSTDTNNRSMNTPTGSVPYNKWTHVVATLNNFDKKMYLNGSLSVSDNVSDDTSFVANWSGQWWFGNRAVIGGNPWSGHYGIVRVYNRELSPEEINQNFDAIKGRYPDLIYND
jgi:hypothetical protein